MFTVQNNVQVQPEPDLGPALAPPSAEGTSLKDRVFQGPVREIRKELRRGDRVYAEIITVIGSTELPPFHANDTMGENRHGADITGLMAMFAKSIVSAKRGR